MVVMMSTPGCGANHRLLAAGDRATARGDLQRLPARRALEQVVVLHLEAGDSDAIDVGAPDDALAGRAARHHPAVLGVGAHARHVELVDLAGDRRVDLAGDVAEADVLGGVAGDGGGQGGLVVGVEIEQLGEHRGGAGGIGDLQRVDDDRRRRHRQGELVPVAVEDRAPLGRQHPGPSPLLGADAAQVVAAAPLQQRHARQHDGQHDEDPHQRGDQPPPRAPGAEALGERGLGRGDRATHPPPPVGRLARRRRSPPLLAQALAGARLTERSDAVALRAVTQRRQHRVVDARAAARRRGDPCRRAHEGTGRVARDRSPRAVIGRREGALGRRIRAVVPPGCVRASAVAPRLLDHAVGRGAHASHLVEGVALG